MWTPFQKAVVGLLSDSYDCASGGRGLGITPHGVSLGADCDPKPQDKKVLQTAYHQGQQQTQGP